MAFLGASLAGDLITIRFDSVLKQTQPSPSRFNINVDNFPATILSVNVSPFDGQVFILLSEIVDSNASVEMVYTDLLGEQSFGGLELEDGSDIDSFTTLIGVADQDRDPPQILKASVKDSLITLDFDEELNSTLPSLNSFTVLVNKRVVSISEIASVGKNRINLSLDKRVAFGDDVSLSYFDVAGNQREGVLEDDSGNDVPSQSNIPVVVNSYDDQPLSISSAVVNGASLSLIFDRNILSTQPSNSAFRIDADGQVIKVRRVNVLPADRQVVLLLDRPVTDRELVTVSYTDPPNNQQKRVVEDIQGNDLATFMKRPVINDTKDMNLLELDDVSLIDVNQLVLTFNKELNETQPTPSAFKIFANQKLNKVSSVAVNSAEGHVLLTLKNPLDTQAEISLSYRDLKSDQKKGVIEDLSGTDFNSVNQFPVNNISTEQTPPQLIDAEVNADLLTLSFNEFVSAPSVKKSVFKLKSDAKKLAIKKIESDVLGENTTIDLYLAKPVKAGGKVIISYRDPAKDQVKGVVQDEQGNDLESFDEYDVVNYTSEIIAKSSASDQATNFSSLPGQGKLTGTKKADVFVFDRSGELGDKKADIITRFEPKKGDLISIDASILPGLKSASDANIEVATSKQEFDDLLEKSANIIFDASKGKIVYDQNGSKPGLGKAGGIITVIDEKIAIKDINDLAAADIVNVFDKLEPKKYVAFSGGGWNSHSLLSGMIAGSLDAHQLEAFEDLSLNARKSQSSSKRVSFDRISGIARTRNKDGLKNPKPGLQQQQGDKLSTAVLDNNIFRRSRKLDSLMKNIEGISANSGGAWFLTALAHSQPFREAFESRDLMSTFLTKGYYGQLRDMFENLNIASPDFSGAAGSVIELVTDSLTQVFGEFGLDVESFMDDIAEIAQSVADAGQDGIDAIVNFINTINFYVNMGVLAGSNRLEWDSVVPNTVYEPYDMKSELSGYQYGTRQGREEWFKDKDLIINASLFTKEVHLDGVKVDVEIFGQDIPCEDKDIFSYVTTPDFPSSRSHATPIAFYSEVKEKGKVPATGAYMGAGSNGRLKFRKEYNTACFPRSENSSKNSFDDGDGWLDIAANNNELNVLQPSVFSSATAGFFASPWTWSFDIPDWGIFDLLPDGINPSDKRVYLADIPIVSAYVEGASRFLKNLAPIIKLNNGKLTAPDNHPFTFSWDEFFDMSVVSDENYENAFDAAVNGGFTRIADGGYTDNTSAASLLRHVQQEEGTDGEFHISLFKQASQFGNKDDIDSTPMYENKFDIPMDLAMLFGIEGSYSNNKYDSDNDDVIDFEGLGRGFGVPTKQVFHEKAWDGIEEPVWDWDDGKVRIDYFDLDVTTVENPAFGIEGGQKGKLHLFVAAHMDAWAAPLMPSFLDAYDENFTVYRDAIANQGGYEHIKDAFGLA